MRELEKQTIQHENSFLGTSQRRLVEYVDSLWLPSSVISICCTSILARGTNRMILWLWCAWVSWPLPHSLSWKVAPLGRISLSVLPNLSSLSGCALEFNLVLHICQQQLVRCIQCSAVSLQCLKILVGMLLPSLLMLPCCNFHCPIFMSLLMKLSNWKHSVASSYKTKTVIVQFRTGPVRVNNHINSQRISLYRHCSHHFETTNH